MRSIFQRYKRLIASTNLKQLETKVVGERLHGIDTHELIQHQILANRCSVYLKDGPVAQHLEVKEREN